MSDQNDKFLDTFPTWLRSLGEDVAAVLAAAEIDGIDMDVKRLLVGGVNYLFKSLDLIPDGIDDIGYLDDAFVLRLSCALVIGIGADLSSAGESRAGAISALAEQAAVVRE